MKKLISFIIAAIIILLTSCNVGQNPNSIVGNWWSVSEEEEKDHVYLSISEDMTFGCWMSTPDYSQITEDIVPDYSGHVKYENGKISLEIDEIDNIGLMLIMDQNAPQKIAIDRKGVMTITFHMIMNDNIEFHLRKVEK